MINAVCHFEISADDLPALQEIYGRLFGWKFEKTPGEMEYYLINPGEGALAGGMMQRQAPEHSPINYVMVESVEDSANKAGQMGATIIMPRTAVPGFGWFAVLLDPQNNPIGLWQDDPNAR